MKTISNIIVLILVVGFFAETTSAEEVKREYHKSWPASDVATLDISNRFGEVKVNNDGGSEVTIDVKVTVNESNERRANELLDKIDVTFSKLGKTVKAVTSLERNFKSHGNFSIDYVVNTPADKNLRIANKYGNTIVAKLTGDGEFISKYGNFTASELKTPESGSLSLELAYGNANIAEVGNIYMELSYSPVGIEEAGELNIESKYSTISIEECGKMVIYSKYDKFKIEEVESVAAEFKYSNITISELLKDLKVESGYGGIKVREVDPDFDFIDITNSYGHISLGLDDSDYSIDASCDYCDIDYPEDEFSGNRMSENHTEKVIGKIGGDNGGKVIVKSRYGGIKLR